MADTCATVRVSDGKGGFITMNQSDFDASRHELFDAKQKTRVGKQSAPPAAPTTESATPATPGIFDEDAEMKRAEALLTAGDEAGAETIIKQIEERSAGRA